jgi:hypothetical protein
VRSSLNVARLPFLHVVDERIKASDMLEAFLAHSPKQVGVTRNDLSCHLASSVEVVAVRMIVSTYGERQIARVAANSKEGFAVQYARHEQSTRLSSFFSEIVSQSVP